MIVNIYGTNYDLEDLLKEIMNNLESLNKSRIHTDSVRMENLETKVSDIENMVEDIRRTLRNV